MLKTSFLRKHKNILRAGISLAVVVFLVNSPVALAQDEIVVTAQKRAEPLAKTPLSIAIISGAALQNAGAFDLKDAQTLTSSLLITSTANEAQTTARLRGIGTVGDNPGLESSVGVVIDGVVRARTSTAMSDLGLIEQIEILKGPQTSLFGKGASAGIIQVNTKRPSFTPSSELSLTLGEFETAAATAYVTGPVAPNIAGSLSLVKRQKQGQYRVHTGDGPRTQSRDNDQNYYSLRGQLFLASTELFKARLIADYTRRDENCCAGVMIARGATTAGYADLLSTDQGVSPIVNPAAREVWANRSTQQIITDSGVSAQADWQPNKDIKLTSITAYRHYDHINGYDADFTSADIYYRLPNGDFGNRIDTVSQELRLSGQTTHADWLLGAYYENERLTRHDQYLYGADYEPYMGLLLSGGADINRISTLTGRPVGASFVAGQGARDIYRQNDQNLAVFANARIKLSQSVSMVMGLRLNNQKKKLSGNYNNSDNGVACSSALGLGSSGLGVICLPWSNPAFNGLSLSQTRNDKAVTGTFKLVWQATQNLMSYASFTHGNKGAGYNLDREQLSNFAVDSDTAFAPESVDAYELGLKARFGSLALDVAAFDQGFEHFQLNTFLGTTFIVKSVPRLRSKGFELEGRYVWPSLGLNLSQSLTFNESQFGKEAVSGLALLPNATASFAPKWSSATQINYHREIQDLAFNLNLSARYNSQYNTGSDLNPIKLQRAYTLFNGRLSLAKPNDSAALELWGTNLSDVRYYQVAFGAPFQAGTFNAFLGQPRTLGVTLRLKR